MKRSLLSVVVVCLLAPASLAATPEWQHGRIVDVRKVVNTKTLYWVVNTPITQDEVSYNVSVHMGSNIYVGSYEVSKQYGAPPPEWTKDHPVKVQLDDDTMFLAVPTGENFRLHITRQKTAPPMVPLTKDELAALDAGAGDDQNATSMIGFDKPAEKAVPRAPATTPGQQAAPLPAEAPSGSVSVSTTPYLAEIYVDGNNMGYSPAKINLPPGKHTVRVEKDGYKSWVKEITMTAGSELTLAATLDKK